ncbi:MAG: hypothetical protein H5U39_01965, partial [Deferribacterales bacterium]|nr:hypothetical protein [Deferribacterales bacterium]
MINWNKLTIKSGEAVQSAQALAEQLSHQQIEPEHLLATLLKQEEGIVKPILQKIGVNIPNLFEDIQENLKKLP